MAAPVRTCVGCGGRFPQAELVRYHVRAGALSMGAGDGRGVYTCRREACVTRALARRAFARRLRQQVEVPADLAAQVAALHPPGGAAVVDTMPR
jgi:predicted RNA-binding protein YlxR (DUF448 family)